MDIAAYLQFVIALGAVLCLIAGLTWLLKRFAFNGVLRAQAPRGERLSVVEARPIDARRKLLLLRRDDVEHLVLLGPERDILIEGNIAAPEGAQCAEAQDGDTVPTPSFGQALGAVALRGARDRAADALARVGKKRA